MIGYIKAYRRFLLTENQTWPEQQRREPLETDRQ
jgi:hypothetical protein